MIKIINAFVNSLAQLGQWALMLLPDTPFSFDISGLESWLGIINYFIPFGAMGSIMVAYISAVILYYAIRWVLRLSQFIE